MNQPLDPHGFSQWIEKKIIQETVENFQVLGSNWKEILAERHGAENLPMSCGGTKNDDLLRKGGEIPSSVKLVNNYQLVKKIYH